MDTTLRSTYAQLLGLSIQDCGSGQGKPVDRAWSASQRSAIGRRRSQTGACLSHIQHML